MAKAKQSSGLKSSFIGAFIVLIVLFVVYGLYWFKVAEMAKDSYVSELSKISDGGAISEPQVSGFPGKMVIQKDREAIRSDKGSVFIDDLRAASWPIPNVPIHITTGQLTLKSAQWLDGLSFDSFDAEMRTNGHEVIFNDSALKQRDFEAKVTGRVDISDPKVAIPDLMVRLSNHQDFLDVLVDSGIIQDQAAKFVGFGMSAFMNADTGTIDVPIYAKNGMINIGPIPVLKLPQSSSADRRERPVVSE